VPRFTAMHYTPTHKHMRTYTAFQKQQNLPSTCLMYPLYMTQIFKREQRSGGGVCVGMLGDGRPVLRYAIPNVSDIRCHCFVPLMTESFQTV
jgi:hypothetical protein